MNLEQETQRWAEQFEVEPSDRVWESLDNRLSKDRLKTKVKWYRHLAAAAAVALVAALGLCYNYLYLDNSNPQTFAVSSPPNGSPMHMEILPDVEDGIYSAYNVRKMAAAYQHNLLANPAKLKQKY